MNLSSSMTIKLQGAINCQPIELLISRFCLLYSKLALSAVYAAPWRNSFLPKSGNKLYSLVFTRKPQYEDFRVFRCQIQIHIDEKQTPVHTMVLGVITSDGDVIPPFIFPHGLTPNMETYIKYLEEVLLTWIERGLLEDPMYMHIHVYTRVCVHPYMCACVCIYIYIYTPTHMCAHTHTHTPTYTHTYTHTYMWQDELDSAWVSNFKC